MKSQRILILAASLALFGAAAPSMAQDTATYMNAELVTADPVRRIVVVRGAGGAKETFDLDDTVGSVGPVKPGDRVVLTVHAGVGRRRITAIAKAASSSGVVIVAPTPLTPRTAAVVVAPATTTVVAVQNKAAAKDAFARQVALLSQEAKPIDSTWAAFVTACKAQPVHTNDGREWFGLWDNRVQADYSSGQCREMFNQMVQSGEAIKQGMAAAEEVALKSLTAGEMRDIRKMNLMDWDGWALPPPQKREP
jgi:hypothetical protein